MDNDETYDDDGKYEKEDDTVSIWVDSILAVTEHEASKPSLIYDNL